MGLFLGAVLKGATGAGLPIVAIPTIAGFYDVRVAVVLGKSIGKQLSAKVFDKTILVLLSVLAIKMIVDASLSIH